MFLDEVNNLAKTGLYRGRWVTRYDALGQPHKTWKPGFMSRIRDELLQIVYYLFPTRADAEKGAAVGGTGFFVGIESDIPGLTHIYAITNKHNITSCRDAVVVRATDNFGKTVHFESEPQDWHPAPRDDLSVLPIGVSASRALAWLGVPKFLTPEIVRQHDIGAGDDVVMVGRFSAHDGGKVNHVSARFGNISMMAAEIEHPWFGRQESILVEMRSISGYSGSPVFVFWEPLSGGMGSRNRDWSTGCLYLLGVDWGHLHNKEPVRLPGDRLHSEKLYINSHSAMSGVVPAWRLLEFLQTDRLREQREADAALAREREETKPFGVSLDGSFEPVAADDGADDEAWEG